MKKESQIPQKKTNKFIKYLQLIFKLSVSTILIYVLISKIGGKTIIDNIKSLNPLIFLFSVFLYILASYLSSLRWRLLMPKPLESKRLFSLYMIGSFFNTCMPGIIGGDAIKAYYLHNELKYSRHVMSNEDRANTIPDSTIAIASVFMDRYVGLFSLMIIGMIALPYTIKYLSDARLKWFLPAAFAVLISGSTVILRFRIGKGIKFLSAIYEYFKFYSSKKDILFKAFLYSLVIQFTGIFSVYGLSYGLSMGLSFLSLLIFVPIIILISTIPVSISGIGIREGAFALLLGQIGVPSATAVSLSLIWFLSSAFASILGLIEYIRYKKTFKNNPTE